MVPAEGVRGGGGGGDDAAAGGQHKGDTADFGDHVAVPFRSLSVGA
jgi:hypothetical protein